MTELFLRDRTLRTERPALVMGIVNVTPDSFWEKSRGGAERALSLAEEGADILDVGGESSRPGAEYVDAEEEIARVIPVIREIRRHSDVAISVDTRKKAVMRAAFEEGADILNDISALEDDPELGAYAAAVKIPVILMHKRGNPAIMQSDTAYQDVFGEVSSYLERRADYAAGCGVRRRNIIVDPGIGFGKDTAANLELIRRCGELCGSRYPVLMALSRKTCVGAMTGRDAAGRLAGTLAADMIAVRNGARILRVHDVAETVDTLNVMRYIDGDAH